MEGWTVEADTTPGYENRITISDRNRDEVRVAVDPGAELDEGGVSIESFSPFLMGERVGLIAYVTVRGFMGGIGFLPDPAESGTWYADGACCKVPEWINIGGLNFRRDDPLLVGED